ncbi:MAG: hypothetical protein WBD67_09670 [Terracidiphilus sp.]
MSLKDTLRKGFGYFLMSFGVSAPKKPAPKNPAPSPRSGPQPPRPEP